MSEARKYKVFLTIAEQSTAQQDRQLTENILSNVGTVICFRSGSPVDEKILLPRFKPYIEDGEMLHLPTFNFYAKLSAIVPQEPLSGSTLLVDKSSSNIMALKVIEASRSNYAKKYKDHSGTLGLSKITSMTESKNYSIKDNLKVKTNEKDRPVENA